MEESTFLFTSESVNEGHPGSFIIVRTFERVLQIKSAIKLATQFWMHASKMTKLPGSLVNAVLRQA